MEKTKEEEKSSAINSYINRCHEEIADLKTENKSLRSRLDDVLKDQKEYLITLRMVFKNNKEIYNGLQQRIREIDNFLKGEKE